MPPSCLTSLLCATFLNNKVKEESSAGIIMALHSEVRILLSYVHLHHLMAMETVNHGDIKVVTVSILKMARICSLTRRMDTSQSARLKFGKSNSL